MQFPGGFKFALKHFQTLFPSEKKPAEFSGDCANSIVSFGVDVMLKDYCPIDSNHF